MSIVVLITAPGTPAARRIAQRILREKAAACVNIIPGLTSLFWWEGKIDRAAETLLVVKTARKKFPALVRLVKSVHPYSVPEIIALPIVAGEASYLRWLHAAVR